MTDIYKSYNKKKLFCCNCGKHGHKYSKCNDPITSLGIIAIKIDDVNIYNKFINFFSDDSYFNLIKSNTINNNVLLNIRNYFDKFKFLMIRRKKTLGYIEYIRGRYDENDINTYTSLFEQMTPTEISDIKNLSFLVLWNDLWQKNADNKFYKSEFEVAQLKHNKLKEISNFYNYLDNIKTEYEIPEWGFPKGRRIYLEKNLNCACREFEEETGLTNSEYTIINNIPHIQEIFYGTDNILYKHTYYYALCKSDINVTLNDNNLNQMEEIGDIGWFNYKECRNLIRSYHYERQKILNETYIFLSSIIENKFNNKLTITNKIEEDNNENLNSSDSESNYESDSISMDDNLIEEDIFIFDKV
tara:strand:+ start:3487 stop:4560 length:1074 start_codon:yes stop_codon:yes gene_type:complete